MEERLDWNGAGRVGMTERHPRKSASFPHYQVLKGNIMILLGTHTPVLSSVLSSFMDYPIQSS